MTLGPCQCYTLRKDRAQSHRGYCTDQDGSLSSVATPVIRRVIWNPSTTGDAEGVGGADLPGFADDDFAGLGEKSETHYDNIHVY